MARNSFGAILALLVGWSITINPHSTGVLVEGTRPLMSAPRLKQATPTPAPRRTAQRVGSHNPICSRRAYPLDRSTPRGIVPPIWKGKPLAPHPCANVQPTWRRCRFGLSSPTGQPKQRRSSTSRSTTAIHVPLTTHHKGGFTASPSPLKA